MWQARELLIVSICLLVAACSAVNPNPNSGMRTVDLMFANGNCEGAKKLAEPAALRGEPWAQFRMGALLVDEKCRPNAQDLGIAIEWLKKATCHASNSDWERGNELAVGSPGYFNARASSTKAAVMLADLAVSAHMEGMAWYYVEYAQSQYEPNEGSYQVLSRKLSAVEESIGRDVFAKKSKNLDVCNNGHIPH